ncbi:MAG: leucine-rich repeat domain-containing protein [Clostridia bacterium]|nr:leucine-rich repeat domain-containing protein [Clostridia bacterium]
MLISLLISVVTCSLYAFVHEHNFDYNIRIYSKHSCTQDGDVQRSCYCGVYVRTYTPATNHAITEWEIVQHPTCTIPGKRVGTCLCGIKTKTEEIPGQHNFVNDVCTRCGADTISAAFEFRPSDDNQGLVITSVDPNLVDVVIPAEYEGKPIVGIARSAFFSKLNIKTIQLPDTLTTLAENAFYNCSNLLSIKLSSNLQTIGNAAFSGCSRLKEVQIPNSVQTIGDSAFYNCISLESVVISRDAQLKTIGGQAFSSCKRLQAIQIPASVTSIGTKAFAF